jgi:hypothetical protein
MGRIEGFMGEAYEQFSENLPESVNEKTRKGAAYYKDLMELPTPSEALSNTDSMSHQMNLEKNYSVQNSKKRF